MKSFLFAWSKEVSFLREVVLLQKIFSEASLKEFGAFLERLCGGLKVELADLSIVGDGWVKVRVSGEDENVAVRFLERKLGLAPVAAGNVERFSVWRGKIVFSGRSRVEVFVDIGVFSPNPVYALIPLQRLQGQLVDGKKFALRRIVDLFGFVDGFPLEVRIVNFDGDKFVAELSKGQLRLLSGWVDARVDRLVVLGVFHERVETAVQRAGLSRDVLSVDFLGVLEHALVCKLGTDAVGVASKLGRWLPGVGFACFSPREVLGLVGERW
jgi:hypothetical protein